MLWYHCRGISSSYTTPEENNNINIPTDGYIYLADFGRKHDRGYGIIIYIMYTVYLYNIIHGVRGCGSEDVKIYSHALVTTKTAAVFINISLFLLLYTLPLLVFIFYFYFSPPIRHCLCALASIIHTHKLARARDTGNYY